MPGNAPMYSHPRHLVPPLSLVKVSAIWSATDVAPEPRDGASGLDRRGLLADVGARAYLVAHAAQVQGVACEDIADDTDMDVPPEE